MPGKGLYFSATKGDGMDYTQCDRCTARAYVHVTLDAGGTLSFCGHDYRTNEEALVAYVVKVDDQRDLLTAR